MWSKAIQILKDINKQIDKNIMSRTIWHQKLYEHRNDNDASYYQYAEAIVDLCYNYRQELSIYNISKHYNTKELEEFKTKRIAPTFTAIGMMEKMQAYVIYKMKPMKLISFMISNLFPTGR